MYLDTFSEETMIIGQLNLKSDKKDIIKDQGRDHTVIGKLKLPSLQKQNGEGLQKTQQVENIQDKPSCPSVTRTADDYDFDDDDNVRTHQKK